MQQMFGKRAKRYGKMLERGIAARQALMKSRQQTGEVLNQSKKVNILEMKRSNPFGINTRYQIVNVREERSEVEKAKGLPPRQIYTAHRKA
jgi:hypothetical protein